MKAPRLTNVVETGFEGEIDALNDRIRELERQMELWHGRAAECIIRMVMAREILGTVCTGCVPEVEHALEALEGK